MQLRVVDYQDPDHWRWLLQDPDGNFVADHQVALNPTEVEYTGFVDLAGFLQDRAEPDRRVASEAELVDRVGRWIGRRVLGERIGQALVDASPVVIDVVVPQAADFLLYRPLELAHVDGQPLAVQDVSLVFEVEGEARGRAKQPIGERLRMLAVFSLPTGGTALALRRERYSLTRLVRRIAGSYGRAIELHVLQYGVTRQRLRDALRDGHGWDVVHFSGHGLAGGLVLERPDGTGELVRTPDLVALLRPARQRLKLVCLSSCLSAAGTAAEARRVLALEVPQALEDEAKQAATQAPLPGLARELVRQLDCAVLAMRFSVVDDFAIALDERLYEGLLGQDQELARAVQLALAEAAGDEPSMGAPAISVATPALFGPLATNLLLSPPRGEPSFNVGTSKVAYFLDEPERFVGRAGVMARASTALAPQNQQHTTVLFHGMAGAGKTACALELAYRHEQSFGALVFWQAPEQGRDITISLRDLAVALETQLRGFEMVHAVGSEIELRRFLPQLTQLLEDQAILLVLDNLESLLTSDGRWRDPNWGLLVEAVVGHRGNSRLVLTSRVPPAGLDGRVLVEPVHALSLDEALLLARELPNLGRLLRRDGAGARGQDQAESGVTLVRRALSVVQGHPELLRLADAEAADPAALRARLAEADRALPGQAGRLAAFFARGESALSPEHYLEVLAGWTRGAAAGLPEGARLLLWFVCALEEADRWSFVVEDNWAELWRRLARPGEPPTVDEALAPLVARALVEVEQQDADAPARYRVHPGVAEAARQDAGQEFQAAADIELAAYWRAVLAQARDVEGHEVGRWVLQAGRSAATYLLRLEDWDTAGWLLEQVVNRDHSPAAVQATLPLLRQIAQATTNTDQELNSAARLAKALGWVQPEAAEAQLREVLDRAIRQERFDVAGVVNGDLANLLLAAGRLQEALAVTEQAPELTRRAGLGPWSQFADGGRRLQLLGLMGREEEVLAAVQQLRGDMATLPETSQQDERSPPWNVRETILDTGRTAALHLGRWGDALALNAEAVNSKLARDATDLDVARTRANDYSALLGLGRLEEAEQLLRNCRVVFEAEGDLADLGKVLSAQAELEDKLGHLGDAIGLEQGALRYKYAAGEPETVGASHNNLANHLERARQVPAVALAHRLAAAVIGYQMSSGSLAGRLRNLADGLARLSDAASLPASFAELCDRVEEIEGVRLAELVARLPARAADGDQALAEVMRLARALPNQAPGGVQQLLEQWTPMVVAVVAAVGGDQQAMAALEPLLVDLERTSDWAALVAVLRRILAGERGQALLAGLDEVDTAIVTQVLEQLDT